MTETELKRQSVLCRREADGVAVVTIDRPERRNALNLEVKRRIADEVAALTADDTVRVIVLTGSGGYFVAGSDITEMATMTPTQLGAATYFGIDGIDITEKQDLRVRILSGGPWYADDRVAFTDYCESDVLTLERLLLAMLPGIDLSRALLRGRFMKAAAAIEWNGTPIDTATLDLVRRHWTGIQDELIADIDRDYGVFEGRSFRLERWQRWLIQHGIPWPTLESGRLDMSDDTFRQMARAYPAVAPMRELRCALSDMRLADLAVGSDDRNRTILSAFRSRTGRCQPSNTRYIFGP